jgi:hypothetical protein
MFGLRYEGCRGVVDQDVDRRLVPDRIHHRIDRNTVADVASEGADLAAEIAAHPCRGSLEQLQPAPADDQLGPELDEAPSHRGTKPGTAAGDQDPLPRQKAFFKHRLIPPHRIVARL